METKYSVMKEQIISLGESSGYYVSLMANTSSLLYENLSDINWVGFYIVKDGGLLVGPFQGKVACVEIEKGKGVCGTSWEKDETELVPNVHGFPGHIACDSASNSEIVIPIHYKGEVRAVLDIDSPSLNRFSEEDREGLEELVKTLESIIQFE